MGAYGYIIEHILMVDIIPDQSVRKAMNEVNAEKRRQCRGLRGGSFCKIMTPYLELEILQFLEETESTDTFERPPTVNELYLHLHTVNHDRVTFIDTRSERFYAKLQMRRRQELTQTTPDQPLDNDAVYYNVAGECPKGRVYDLESLGRKKRRYADPDASASQCMYVKFCFFGDVSTPKELLEGVQAMEQVLEIVHDILLLSLSLLAAQRIQLASVCKGEAELGRRLTVESVVDVLQLARLCDAPDLYLKCMNLVLREEKAVQGTEGGSFCKIMTLILSWRFFNSLKRLNRTLKELLEGVQAMEQAIHLSKGETHLLRNSENSEEILDI
ncbi:hypothetical protein Syun_002083 [Stephania yunnanensis]|uniref:Uncharacterized protein n=1 Tax=Stephania yunnanensis TaxID=152371 RepID=A0AAP0Q7Q5_9MAGN